MTTPGRCPHCQAKVSRLADVCPECGGKLVAGTPWYVYLVGGLLVLMLFLWLGDLGAVARVLANLWASLRT